MVVVVGGGVPRPPRLRIFVPPKQKFLRRPCSLQPMQATISCPANFDRHLKSTVANLLRLIEIFFLQFFSILSVNDYYIMLIRLAESLTQNTFKNHHEQPIFNNRYLYARLINKWQKQQQHHIIVKPQIYQVPCR